MNILPEEFDRLTGAVKIPLSEKSKRIYEQENDTYRRDFQQPLPPPPPPKPRLDFRTPLTPQQKKRMREEIEKARTLLEKKGVLEKRRAKKNNGKSKSGVTARNRKRAA